MEIEEIVKAWSLEDVGPNRVKLIASYWTPEFVHDDESITTMAAHAIGLFVLANPTICVTNPEVEIELPCEDHEDLYVVYVYFEVK